MSHYQSKGDRSEAQLKKTGRSSGPGHQRSGALSTAVKGGGAGGPSPSGSAPPAPAGSHSTSQPFPAGAASGRPTTPGSSTNRGGKRSNGPVGTGRSVQSGGSVDHGSSYRNPQYSATHQTNQQVQQQQQAPVVRQSVGSADVSQHSPTSSGQQLELKQATPVSQPTLITASKVGGTGAPVPSPKQSSHNVVTGAAAKPPAPVVPNPNVIVPEPASPVAAASSVDARSPLQPSFSFQFGSISPTFMNLGPGMQIPARTSSAPPNLDEQKREQARFEASRTMVTKKVPTVPSGQQQGQVQAPAPAQAQLVQVQAQGQLQVQNQAQQAQSQAQVQSQQAQSQGQVQSQQAQSQAQVQSQQAQSQGQVQSQQAQSQAQVQSQQAQSQGQVQSQQAQSQAQVQSQQAQSQSQVQSQQAQSQAQVQSQQAQSQAHVQAPAQQAQSQAHVQAPAQQAQAQAQQAQAHAQQQQVLAQQTLPQQTLSQQGLVQQSLSQGMKFPQSMMPQQTLPQQGLVQQSLSQGMKYPQSMMPPHGAQIISQQMSNPLAGQISGQQVPPQMTHQLGGQMGGGMCGQLPPGISGAQYGPPATNIILPQPSRPVRIVNPETLEELRFDAKSKKGELYIDAGPPTSVAASAGLQVRVSANGLPQPRSVNYGSAPHHSMVPPSMNYYQQLQSGPYTHTAPSFYQSVPLKGAPGGAPGNTPPVRYSFGPQNSAQGMPYMSHPGVQSNPPVSKVGPSGGGLAGPAGPEMMGVAPSAAGPLGGPTHPIMQPVSPSVAGRLSVPSQSLQASGTHAPANRRAFSLVPGSTLTTASVPVISPTSSVVAFKFGDVEASTSTTSVSSSEESATDDVPPTHSQPSAIKEPEPLGSDSGIVDLRKIGGLEIEESVDTAFLSGKNSTGQESALQKEGSNEKDKWIGVLGDSEATADDTGESAAGSLPESSNISVPAGDLSVEVADIGLASDGPFQATPVNHGSPSGGLVETDNNPSIPAQDPSGEEKERVSADNMQKDDSREPTHLLSNIVVEGKDENTELVEDLSSDNPESDGAVGASPTAGAEKLLTSLQELKQSGKKQIENDVEVDTISCEPSGEASSNGPVTHGSCSGSPGEARCEPFPHQDLAVQEAETDSADNGLKDALSDDEASSTSLAKTVSEMQLERIGSVDDLNPRDSPPSTSATGSSPKAESGKRTSITGMSPPAEAKNLLAEAKNLLTSVVVDVKQSGNKKKKKKEIYAKADAQGPTADLFDAYMAPEEKKLDDVKRTKVPGLLGPGADTKKDSLSGSERPVLKELDDWEDAADSTPIAPSPSSTPSVNLVPGEATNAGDCGVRKYTKDYLLSQRDLHKELPRAFEIRADIADIILIAQAGSDGLSSPGRGLDRQSSGGPRLDRRNSNVSTEEDRWTRQGISSPGRASSDNRMEMGMPGPPGGFRPGQGTNAGLMRMPPGMRPGVGPPGMMPMVGLLPGGPLLPQHMMVPPGPGRNVGGVDADRWQRAPVGQKGLIPSPRTPLPAIHKTENRYQVGKVSDEEQLKQRLIKGILNKLTPQNFEKLFSQVKEVNIDSATTLTGVISQIFDKALTEPTFCEMYAMFCVQLAEELPEFVEEDEKITFKRVLLNKCQEEFERGEREQEEAEKVEEDGEVKLTPEEREEKRTSARRRMLGNIRFIGELYKKAMLTERIMHECIKKLLGEYQNPDEEDVEALCKLMSTIGGIIDHVKAKEHIDAYFKRMEKLSENLKLSSRLRFMLKDVIDLRRNGWQERRKVEGPKKIDQVHRDAVQERASRDRPQPRGGIIPGGGRRPVSDYPGRVPSSPSFPPVPMGGPMMGGIRGAQPPSGNVRGGFGQDVRMEDRLSMESRPLPQQRSADEGTLTLGPQGGLGRHMAGRQPLVSGRSALADVPPMMLGDARRPGMGPMPGFGGMIPPYGSRDEMSMRGTGAERPLGVADRPLLERPLVPERLGPPLSGRDLRVPDRSPIERTGISVGLNASLRPLTPPTAAAVRASAATPVSLSEDQLKKKSISALTEYFIVRDIKEAAQCVEDLKNPKFHPTMVSIWVSDALDKKDLERELLVKLLIYISKERDPPLLTFEHISRGFELVLSMLEDTTVDVPKAPEYVAMMFAKLLIAGVFTLVQIGKLLKEGGMDTGGLLEIGHALIMFGVVLDTIRKEKGEAVMVDLYRATNLNVEDFVSPEDKRKGGKFEAFLEKGNLQCLYPMIPVEKYLGEAIFSEEPVADILKWLEKNVPQSTTSEPAFWRMIMTQVLRHCVPMDTSGKALAPHFERSLDLKIKRYSTLLKKLTPGNLRLAEASQRQYIAAAQLFANDLGHPPGLLTALFSTLYSEDVISEQAFLKWQDDVKDSTPGRDKAIKETFNWFRWLVEAPEEGGDDDD